MVVVMLVGAVAVADGGHRHLIVFLTSLQTLIRGSYPQCT